MEAGRIIGGTGNNSLFFATTCAVPKSGTFCQVKGKSTDAAFEKSLKNAMGKNDEAALKKACQEFESIFLSMMYKEMKATVPKSGLIPDDIGMDVYNSMLDEMLMENASKSSRLGLGDILYKQLDRQLKAEYKLDG